MRRFLSAVALAAFAHDARAQEAQPAPQPAPAQQSQPAPQPAPTQLPQVDDEPDDDAPTEDEIVVEAAGDQTRIDRRVYTLTNDPAAQTSSMLDVLPRIPSVTVAPSGAISLLGATGVTIQIDGQPVPSQSLDGVLRTLTGAQVERIEVITNPSAQHSPQSSAGIINIITRQRFARGLTGSVQAYGDTTSSYGINASPNWARGPWSLSGRLGFNHNSFDSDSERIRESFASGDLTSETGRSEFEGDGLYGGATIAYQPTEKRKISAAFDSFAWDASGRTAIAGATNGAPVSTQLLQNDSTFRNQRASFEFRQDGARQGETLKLNGAFIRFDNGFDRTITAQSASGSPPSQFAAFLDSEQANANVRLDFERPLREQRFLTLGAAFDQTDQQIETAFVTLSGAPGPGDFRRTLEGVQSTIAVYGTFEFRTGDWRILPGIRAEAYRREVRSAGAETDATEFRLFPSLHVRRELTEDLDLDLSYSSRIARPTIEFLDPALRFSDAARAFAGNPDLRPTTTDAFEANLTYQKSGHSFSFTLYDRLSEDIVSQFTELRSDGVTVTTQVNAGESEQRGAQAILRGPLGPRWRYSLSANGLSRAFDVLDNGLIARREEFEYGGNAQLEYRDPNQAQVNADFVQLDLQFQGPQHFLQGERDEFVVANLTWRRRLTEKLSGMATLQDIFDSQNNASRIVTDDFTERSEFHGPGARIRIALIYSLGSGPSRPEEVRSGPSGPQE